MPGAGWVQQATVAVAVLLSEDQHGLFATPVDPEEWGLDDYFSVVARPMDLGTVQVRADLACCGRVCVLAALTRSAPTRIDTHASTTPTPTPTPNQQANLADGHYAQFGAFAADVRLVFSNAVLYNEDRENEVHLEARRLAELADRFLTPLVASPPDAGARQPAGAAGTVAQQPQPQHPQEQQRPAPSGVLQERQLAGGARGADGVGRAKQQ